MTTSDEQHLELIRQSFPSLEKDELHHIANITELCSYPPGAVLCHEGVFEDVFYILARGQAKITMKVNDQGEERLLRIIGPGEHFGEMGLIQESPRAATVATLTDVDVLEMHKADFEAVLSMSPRMAVRLLRTTVERMRSNDELIIRELRQVNNVLRQLDRNKLEFIQVAAHELRTPLTVMMGYTSVLQVDPNLQSNAQLREILEGIVKGTKRLHEIVNTMLDVTRVAGDDLEISAAPLLIRSMVNDVVKKLKSAVAARQLQLFENHDPNLPFINGDPQLIEKALHHLLVNAIKYTPDGGEIHVTTRAADIDGLPGVEVEVRDTGIGVDPEQQELIFEKFYQVGSVELHSSGKTSFMGGGPGVGLAIAYGVAKAHGGKIWVESAGHDEVNLPGSTFYVQLPIDPPKLQKDPEPNSGQS